MHKCNMQKPDTGNQTLPRGVSPMDEQQKKYNIGSDIKTLLGKDCKVEKIIKFLRDVDIYEEIQ